MTLFISSLISSTPLFDAASISIISGFPLNERQFSHLPHAIPLLLSKQLIDFAEAVASDLGFKQTYLTGRESAWAFYEKLGYTTNHKISKIGRVRIKEYTKKLVAHEMVKEMETNG